MFSLEDIFSRRVIFSVRSLRRAPKALGGLKEKIHSLSSLHLRLLLTLCLVSLFSNEGNAAKSWGNHTPTYTFDIPQQSVDAALNQLAIQVDALLLFPYDLVLSVDANALAGVYTAENALALLLQGTGLSGDLTRGGVIAISTISSLEMYGQEEITMKSKKKILATAIGFLIAGGSGVVSAQTESVETRGEELMEEVVVTASYRKAVEQAIEMKRMATGFSDSIVATDVADFPEQNLVEALQRMSGISMTRNKGIGTNVSVRSLPGDFTHVSVNDLATASGSGGRSVSLDVYASEVIQNVTVKKSPTAADQEGGIAGSIEIQTARPFDFKGDRFVASVEAAHNSISEVVDPKYSFMGSKQVGDWGALFSYTGNTRTNRTDRNGGSTLKASSDWLENSNSEAFQNALSDYGYVINDPNDRAETSLLATMKKPARNAYLTDQDRWGSTLSLQYKPSDTFTLTLDGMLGGYENIYTDYDISNYVIAGDNYPEEIHAIDTTSLAQWGIGVITDATYAASQHELNVQRGSSDTEYNQLSLDMEWEVAGWNIDGLVGYSGATSTFSKDQVKYLAYERSRTRYTTTGAETIMAAPSVNDPTPWDPYALESVGDYKFYEYRKEIWDIEDDKYAAQLDFQNDFDTDWFSLQFGIRYTDKTKQANYGDAKFKGPGEGDESWRWNRPLTTDEVSSITSLVDGGSGKAGVDLDWYTVNADQMDELYVYDGFTSSFKEGSFWKVQEKTTSFYLMTDFTFDIADMPVSLNTGVRALDNKVVSSGYHQVQNSDGSTDYGDTPVSATGNSSDYLPSLNLSIDLTDDLVFRAAASKTIMRPALNQLAFKRTADWTNYRYNDGNPSLESTEADQWELGFEWYLPEGGLVAISYFDKKIKGALEKELTGTISNVQVLDNEGNATNVTFDVYQQVNASESYDISGIEVNAQLLLGTFSDYLDGFGVNANATFLDTSLVDGSDLPFVPNTPRDFIDDTYNATVYYENDTYDVRLSYNYKSEYYDEISYNTYPVYRAAYSQFDFAAGYNVTDNIKVSLKVINLTDEVTESYNMSESFMSGYEKSGRRISLGVRSDF